MGEMIYVPTTLEEALQIRKETGARPLAGGSDIMVQGKRGIGLCPELPYPVMIISGLDELKGITASEDGPVTIGALTTPSEIASSSIVPWHVRKAASVLASPQLTRKSAKVICSR